MEVADVIGYLKEDGFANEHFQMLRGTYKSIWAERFYEYGLFGMRGDEDINDRRIVVGRKPHLNRSTLINYHYCGKNHWKYTVSNGCRGAVFHLSGESLDTLTFTNDSVFDVINSKHYEEYIKKFQSSLPIDIIPLLEKKYIYREIGNVGIQTRGGYTLLLTFDKEKNIDQHIQIRTEDWIKWKQFFCPDPRSFSFFE